MGAPSKSEDKPRGAHCDAILFTKTLPPKDNLPHRTNPHVATRHRNRQKIVFCRRSYSYTPIFATGTKRVIIGHISDVTHASDRRPNQSKKAVRRLPPIGRRLPPLWCCFGAVSAPFRHIARRARGFAVPPCRSFATITLTLVSTESYENT